MFFTCELVLIVFEVYPIYLSEFSCQIQVLDIFLIQLLPLHFESINLWFTISCHILKYKFMICSVVKFLTRKNQDRNLFVRAWFSSIAINLVLYINFCKWFNILLRNTNEFITDFVLNFWRTLQMFIRKVNEVDYQCIQVSFVILKDKAVSVGFFIVNLRFDISNQDNFSSP